jgi:hypothetical protein
MMSRDKSEEEGESEKWEEGWNKEREEKKIVYSIKHITSLTNLPHTATPLEKMSKFNSNLMGFSVEVVKRRFLLTILWNIQLNSKIPPPQRALLSYEKIVRGIKENWEFSWNISWYASLKFVQSLSLYDLC